MGKRKRQKKLHYDDKGQFRWETYFVGGKQKRQKVRTVDGMDADEFWRRNADPIALHQAGDYHVSDELESQGAQAADLELRGAKESSQADDDDTDWPF